MINRMSYVYGTIKNYKDGKIIPITEGDNEAVVMKTYDCYSYGFSNGKYGKQLVLVLKDDNQKAFIESLYLMRDRILKVLKTKGIHRGKKGEVPSILRCFRDQDPNKLPILYLKTSWDIAVDSKVDSDKDIMNFNGPCKVNVALTVDGVYFSNESLSDNNISILLTAREVVITEYVESTRAKYSKQF